MKDRIKSELVLYREHLFEDADDLLKDIEAQRITTTQRAEILRYLINAHLEMAEALSELISDTDHQPVH